MKEFKQFLNRMVFIILLIAAELNSGHAASYFVNNAGSPPCINETGDGSNSKPWCTIAYGLSRLHSGDTLYVMGGTYNEAFTISGPAGTTVRPTVIKAWTGSNVILTANDVTKGRITIENTSHIVFDGFQITKFNYAMFIESSDHILVQNCEMHEIGQEAIHIRKNSAFITIQNCRIHDTNKWRYNGEGVYVGTSSSGPRDNTNNVTVRKCVIYNTNDEGIELKPGTHDCLVEGNLMYHIMVNPHFSGEAGAIEVNQATIHCPKCEDSIQTWHSNPNHVIRNNIVHSTKTGIRAGTGSIVYNNVIYNIPDPFFGILVDNSSMDTYLRKIYHNTVDVPVERAIVVQSANAEVKNNIGPSSPTNIASDKDFYRSTSTGEEDYHLVKGSSPVDAGINSDISTDLEGNVRPMGARYDIGAYEYSNRKKNQNKKTR